MKLLPAILSVAVIFSALISRGQEQRPGSCKVVVQANVEVADADFSLANLLTPASCAELRQSAAGLRVGRVPLAGSPRILTGDEIRALLQKITNPRDRNSIASYSVDIPERVSVRRAGPRTSCTEITLRLQSAPASHPIPPEIDLASAAQSSPRRNIACGAEGRIAQGTPLDFPRTAWDPVLGTWDISARCVHPADCVPFLVQVPDQGSRFKKLLPIHSTAAKTIATKKPLVRPGEAVTLLWDQDGIRLLVPAVCLDKGATGDAVRARILRGGRTVRAVVESAGRLRVTS